MTTTEIANRLAELCRQGDFETAQKELFADNAASIEPYASPAFEKETKGLKAILEKGKKWDEMVKETHEITVSDPLIASNSFACTMQINVTMKEGGPMDMTELCVYQVKDGKIVSEQFFV
jgi:ketosteroid isomerase-like protein